MESIPHITQLIPNAIIFTNLANVGSIPQK